MHGAEPRPHPAIQDALEVGDRAAGKGIAKLVGVHARHVHHPSELGVEDHGGDHRPCEREHRPSSRCLGVPVHARGW